MVRIQVPVYGAVNSVNRIPWCLEATALSLGHGHKDDCEGCDIRGGTRFDRQKPGEIMKRFRLSELCVLTGLSEIEVKRILSNNVKSKEETEGVKGYYSEYALRTLFDHRQGENRSISADSLFDEHTDSSLRKQILTYQLSSVLSDSERARLLNLPHGCRIREGAKILDPQNFKCGENVWIGEGAILDAQGGLEIGDNSQIGLSVMVWSHTSHKQAISGLTGSKIKEGIQYKRTRIGSNVFIAGPSVISPGVTIGDKVIISPLTFVGHDIPDKTVVSPHREFQSLENRVAELEKEIAELKGGSC